MATIQETARQVSILVPKVMAGVKGGFLPTEEVTPQQMITILTLGELGKAKITTLSRRMGVSPPTITGIVDRLERNGYVERARDENDRRVVFVSITQKGASVVVKVRQAIQKRWMKMMIYLNAQERNRYVAILRKIVDGLARDAENDQGGM